jgi:hypothetical protein
LDRILTSCQRVRVAEEAAYSYNRGGTEITGPSIKLLEVVAQHWGNIEFGFRELARYPATRTQPGESVVEAFCWDMQTNARRKVSFTVQHAMKANKTLKILTDPRDIYEYVANNAQRRVRTCMENIIPRDILDEAMDQCSKTLKEKAPVTTEGITKLLDAFKRFDVTKEQIETRLQRRIDTMTSAQMAAMRRIYKSLDEGMSNADEWFKVEEAKGSKVATSDLNDKVGTKTKKPKAEPKEEPVSNGPMLEKLKKQMAAATVDEARNLYDLVCGPDSTVELTEDEATSIGDWRDSRLAELAK